MMEHRADLFAIGGAERDILGNAACVQIQVMEHIVDDANHHVVSARVVSKISHAARGSPFVHRGFDRFRPVGSVEGEAAYREGLAIDQQHAVVAAPD